MQASTPSQPRFLDQVRLVCPRCHFSPRTEEAYVFWIRPFILFHGKRHPTEMGKIEVVAFLNPLAGARRVSASTQSEALNAQLFLYKRVLETVPGWFDGLVRVQRQQTLPVVLSEAEVSRVLDAISGTPLLMAQLLYGAGLRVMECMTLRVKDFDFDRSTITVRLGKGAKDRVTLLPRLCRTALQTHLLRVANQMSASERSWDRRDCPQLAGQRPSTRRRDTTASIPSPAYEATQAQRRRGVRSGQPRKLQHTVIDPAKPQ